jgi:nitrate reductase gamma subunit
MDKSNIAFGLITGILAVYITVALLLSRARESRVGRASRQRIAGHKH